MKNEGTIEAKQSRQLSVAENLLSLMLRALPIKHGKHRLLELIAPKMWDKSGKSVAISIQGKEIIVQPNDLVGWHFAILKSFDPEVVEVLEKACHPTVKEVFWDIGANKGACFCGLAIKLPLVQVVAIEPQAALWADNINNLNSICPGRYEYVQAGIGEEEAELTLVVPKSNMGKASLHIDQIGPEDYQEVIKIRTAAEIAESSKFGWPTVIKIDVERHEPQVFKSLSPCFSSNRCKLTIFENHESETEAFNTIRAITEPHGYKIFGIKKSPWTTRLVSAETQLPGVTDYAVIREDLLTERNRLRELIAS